MIQQPGSPGSKKLQRSLFSAISKLCRAPFLEFSAVEFLARLTVHIPNRYQHYRRYAGIYASATRRHLGLGSFCRRSRGKSKPRAWRPNLGPVRPGIGRFGLLVAFSCRRRGACPSCGAKYRVETAAHLVDAVLPRVPYRQWVLSLPKRLRYYAGHDSRHGAALLRIFLRAVETEIRRSTTDVPMDLPTPARMAAVSFFHRCGASLNEYLHFHSLISDGLFSLPVEASPESPPSFHPARPIEEKEIDRLTETLRRRMLRYATRKNLLDPEETQNMETWQGHGGFSLYASHPIAAEDRSALERVARYCARPPFAENRLRLLDDGRVLYEARARKGLARETLLLPPLLFLDRIAKVIPPPRVHRHIY